MSKFFNIDSPLMTGLTKLADILILNILTVVCCIPVVTIGASFTAMHYMLLKIVRDEETYVVKGFFKSFALNFKQATAIWLIKVLVFAFMAADFLVVLKSGITFPTWVFTGICVVSIILYLMGFYAFPLLSRFENSVFRTIKNSALVGILTFPKTILMVVVTLLPIAGLIYVPQIIPIIILLGIAGPGYICALLYNKTFNKFEPKVEEEDPDAWFIEEDESTENETEENETQENELDNTTEKITTDTEQ